MTSSLDHHHRRSSTALLFAAARSSFPNFRCARTSARTLLCWSSKGNGAEAGAGANEGKQAHVIADAGIGRIERPGLQRRTWVPASERMMLARRGRAYGPIGVVVDRSVPQIIVRTGRAAHSVGSIDRMSGPMRERAWHVGAKAKLAVYVQKQRDKGGGKHRESNAGYAHFPQLAAMLFLAAYKGSLRQGMRLAPAGSWVQLAVETAVGSTGPFARAARTGEPAGGNHILLGHG